MSMDPVANEVIVHYELSLTAQDMVFVPSLKIMERMDVKKTVLNQATQNIDTFLFSLVM